MADVRVAEGILRIDLSIPERVLSLHRTEMHVPIRQVTSATAVPDVMAQLRGARMPGARVPGRLAIGTWSGERNGVAFHDFVLVRRPGPGVVIGLERGEYDRIVLDCADPQALIDELQG